MNCLILYNLNDCVQALKIRLKFHQIAGEIELRFASKRLAPYLQCNSIFKAGTHVLSLKFAVFLVYVKIEFKKKNSQKGKEQKKSKSDSFCEQKKNKKEMEFEQRLAKEKEGRLEKEKQLKINRLVQEVCCILLLSEKFY